jgi:protein TonB
MRYRPSLNAATAYGDADSVFQPLRSTGKSAGAPRRIETKPASTIANKMKNKVMLIAFSVGSLVLLPILIAQIYPRVMGKTAVAKQSVVVSQPTTTASAPVTNIQPVNSQQKPSPMTQLATKGQTQPTQPGAQQTTAAPAPVQTAAVQSDMMNKQLAAPSLIPTSARMAADKDAPPSGEFGPIAADGLGGNASNTAAGVFGGQGRPKVKVDAPKTINVSAGVAVGLLISRTPPTYPQIARTARVSGTVVLQATISKSGAIEGLHVVSGPDMLRQAALDAVRTWRYKPYMLNNEPVTVETTVNVIFSL